MKPNISLAGRDGRYLKLSAGPDGMRLELGDAADREPVYSALLQQMLALSVGRPWAMQPAELTDVQLHEEQDAVCVHATAPGWQIRCDWRFDPDGHLAMRVEWRYQGETPVVRDAAVGVLLPLPVQIEEKLTIPHLIYNNNPSADPQRLVPRIGTDEGQGLVVEEHRLPIPCVQSEWLTEAGARYLSVFTRPAWREGQGGECIYGSLGAWSGESGGTTVAALSGVLMFDGRPDVAYTSRNRTESWTAGYLQLEPGDSYSQELVLDWGAPEAPGRAFRRIVETGRRLFLPHHSPAAPLTAAEIVRLKTHALDDRWREAGEAAGYVKFNDTNAFGNVSPHPLHFMYGWTGQCLKLAWCDARLGLSGQEEERVRRCERAVDFYVQHSEAAGVPGLRRPMYMLDGGEWDDFRQDGQAVVSSRAYGETLADLADIILLFREHSRPVPASWTRALSEAMDFLMGSGLPSGVLPASWTLQGMAADEMVTAAGIPCVMAAIKAYRVTRTESWLDWAGTGLRHYYEYHAASFERPFARSTLDARCEDKEAGMYFFLAAYEVFRLTGDLVYREWAEVAADWMLTFVYVWNPVYDRGSTFEAADFRAVGWPGVSVQNHHLDVFFPSYELWDMGRMTGNPIYQMWGSTSFLAMGQGIAQAEGEWGFTIVGEQGEGFFQTSYNGRSQANNWNPAWVIALVLQNGLRFCGQPEHETIMKERIVC